MNNFYMNIKQNLNYNNHIREIINDFNELSDNEIKSLFDDDEIDFNWKRAIAEFCDKRIIQLPFNIFASVLFYLENPYLFASNYKNRINTLSFEELVSLIYDVNLDADCLVEITKMEVFKKYLKEEKEHHLGTKLQSFVILKELYLNNYDIKQLNSIGIKIINLLEISQNYTEDIRILIDAYMEKIIEKDQEINFDSDINAIGIKMMNYYYKNHKKLSNKLMEFYIRFRLKDLNLQNCCQRIIISKDNEDNEDTCGRYHELTGTLEIFSNYLTKRLREIFNRLNFNNEHMINDFINLSELEILSHELGHIVRYKEWKEFETKEETLKDNKSLYYWYKDHLLHLLLGDKKYYQLHENFIEENRADLFSIFDSSIQINKYFKDSFSKKQLQNLCKKDAGDIIKLYTKHNESSESTIITPMQKFDEFFSIYFPIEEKYLIRQDENSNNIMNNLLLGDEIPKYVLTEFTKIASGETITDDLYKETLKIIDDAQYCNLEEVRKQRKI